MNTNKHNQNINMKYTATATHQPLDGRVPGLTLVQEDGQARTFPLFSIQFSKNGGTPCLGYNAIVVDAPRDRAVPAEGPIAFERRRKANLSMLCLAMTELDGMLRIMETAFVKDCNWDRFTIAMVEQFGCEPCRTDGYPYFLAYRGDSLPGCQVAWPTNPQEEQT